MLLIFEIMIRTKYDLKVLYEVKLRNKLYIKKSTNNNVNNNKRNPLSNLIRFIIELES